MSVTDRIRSIYRNFREGKTRESNQKSITSTTTSPEVIGKTYTRVVDEEGRYIGEQITTTSTPGTTTQDVVTTVGGKTTIRSGGSRTEEGTTITADSGRIEGEVVSGGKEAGIMTFNKQTESNLGSYSVNPSVSVNSNLSPSQSVEKYDYLGDVRTTSVGGKQTAGTYEYNLASLDLNRKASEGISITPDEIRSSQLYARRERLGYFGGDTTAITSRNVRLTTSSLGVAGLQTGIGIGSFYTGLYTAFAGQGFKAGSLYNIKAPGINTDNLKAIRDAPTTPRVSGIDTFSIARPQAFFKGATTLTLIGAGAYGGATAYSSARASGLSRTATANYLAGETVSMASPINIRSGIVGTTTTTTRPVQVGGFESRTVNLGGGKSVSTGQANYIQASVTRYGVINKNLFGGTTPTIKGTGGFTTQTVTAVDFGKSTNGLTATKGVRTIKTTTTPIVQKDAFTLGRGSPVTSVSGEYTASIGRTYSSPTGSLTSGKFFTFDPQTNIFTGTDFISGGTNKFTTSYKGQTVTTGTGENLVPGSRLIKGVIKTLNPNPTGSSSFSSGNGGVGNTQNIQKSLTGGFTTPSLTTVGVPKTPVLPKTTGITATGLGLGLASGLSSVSATSSVAPSVTTIKPLSSTQSLQQSLTTTTVVTQRPVSTSVTSSATSLTSISPVTSITPGSIGRGITNVNSPIVPGLAIPFIPGGSLGGFPKSRSVGATKIRAYAPSFKALAFNIRGSKRTGVLTGLEFRPITKGFSIRNILRGR